MSERLPVLSGKEIIKALAKVGFVPVRQKGSHVFLRHFDGSQSGALTRSLFISDKHGCGGCGLSAAIVRGRAFNVL